MSGHARYHDPSGEQRTAYDQNYYSGNTRNQSEQRYSGNYYGGSTQSFHEIKYEQQSAIDRSYDQSYLGQQQQQRNRYPPEEPAQKYHAEDACQRRVHQQPSYDNRPPPDFNNQRPTPYQGDYHRGERRNENVSSRIDVGNAPSLQPKVIAETTHKGGGAAVFKVVGKPNANSQVNDPPPSSAHDYQYASQSHGKGLSPIREQPPAFKPPAAAPPPQRTYDDHQAHTKPYGGYAKDPYTSDPYPPRAAPPRERIYSNEAEERHSGSYYQQRDELESSGYGSTTYTSDRSYSERPTPINKPPPPPAHQENENYQGYDRKYQQQQQPPPPHHSYRDEHQHGGYQQPPPKTTQWAKQPSEDSRVVAGGGGGPYRDPDGVDQSRIKGVKDVKRIFEKPQEVPPFPQGPSTRVGSSRYVNVMNPQPPQQQPPPPQPRRSSSDDYPQRRPQPSQDTYQPYHQQQHNQYTNDNNRRSPPPQRDYYPPRDPPRSPPAPAAAVVEQHPRYYDNNDQPPRRHQYDRPSYDEQYYEQRPRQPEYPPQQERMPPPQAADPAPARYNDPPPPSRGYHGYQDDRHRPYEDDRRRPPPPQEEERRPRDPPPHQRLDDRYHEGNYSSIYHHHRQHHPRHARIVYDGRHVNNSNNYYAAPNAVEAPPPPPPNKPMVVGVRFAKEETPPAPAPVSPQHRRDTRQQYTGQQDYTRSSEEYQPRNGDDRYQPPANNRTSYPPRDQPPPASDHLPPYSTSPQRHNDHYPPRNEHENQPVYAPPPQPVNRPPQNRSHPPRNEHENQPVYAPPPQPANRPPQNRSHYQQPSEPAPTGYGPPISRNQAPKSYQEPGSTGYGPPGSKNQPKIYQEPAPTSYGPPINKNQPKSYQEPVPTSYGPPINKSQPKSYQEPAPTGYGPPISKNQAPKSYQEPAPTGYGPPINKNQPKSYQEPASYDHDQQQEADYRRREVHHHQQADLMTNEEVEQRFAHLGRSQQQLNRIRATHDDTETDNESNYVPSIVARSYNQFSQQQQQQQQQQERNDDFKSSDLPIAARPPRHPFDPIDDDSSEGIDVDAVPTPPFNKYFARTQHPLDSYAPHGAREDLSSRLNATRLDNDGIQPAMSNSEIYRQRPKPPGTATAAKKSVPPRKPLRRLLKNQQQANNRTNVPAAATQHRQPTEMAASQPPFNDVDSAAAPPKSLNHNHSRDRLRVARSGPPRKPPTRGSSSEDLMRDMQEYEVSVYPNERRKPRESPLVVVEAPANPKPVDTHHQVVPTRTNASRKSTRQQTPKPASQPAANDQSSNKPKSSFQPVGGKDKANTKIYFKKVDPAVAASKTGKKEEKAPEAEVIRTESISADPKKRPVAYTDLLDQFKSARDSAYRNVLKKQQDMAMRPFKMLGNAAKRSLSPKKSPQEKVVSKNTAKIANCPPGEEIDSDVYERNKPKLAGSNRNSERTRDRGRSRSRERIMSPERPRGRSRERIVSPERPRGRSRERIMSPERPRGRSRERIMSPERPRGRSRERIMSPERPRGRSKERIINDDYPRRHINRDEMVRHSDRYGREVNAYRPPSDRNFNEPEWVEQVRRKRNADHKVPSSVSSSTVHERGWVKDPRWAPNRTKEVDFEEDYERGARRAPVINDFRPSQPPKQLLPSKLMVKAPSSGKPSGGNAWKRDLGQRNKAAVRKR